MKKYRKKPIAVEAIQLRSHTYDDVIKFIGDKGKRVNVTDGRLAILLSVPEGELIVEEFEWIAKDSAGEFYPIQDEVFKETYEQVEE